MIGKHLKDHKKDYLVKRKKYKIKENSCFDTEHLKFNEKDYVGDYLNKYRKTPEKKWSQNRQKYEKWC